MNEYWIVKEKKTGKVIANCGDINDAIMMVSFDSQNRVYSRHRCLMDQIIDVTSTTDKELPGQIGLPSGSVKQIYQNTKRLQKGDGEPIIV